MPPIIVEAMPARFWQNRRQGVDHDRSSTSADGRDLPTATPYSSPATSRRLPDGDILATLEREGARAVALFRSLPAERADFAYAPGKWTIREVVAHVSDSERVFAYRALRFGRADATPLRGLRPGRSGCPTRTPARAPGRS